MSDWDSFEFELRFAGEKLNPELINIEAYRLSLNKLILPQEWTEDLQRLYIVRSVHGTTALEGNPLSEEEVSRQLLDLASVRQDQIHAQTENAAKAFEWVEQNFGEQRPIRLEDIQTIHRLLTSGSDEGDDVPGQLRRSGHNVTVGNPQLGGVHRAPSGGSQTERLTHDFLTFIDSDRFRKQPVVIQALLAHFYFVTLHPFGNGNGRTTRCIEAAILYSGGYNTHGFYSLSNYFYRNRDDYCRKLQETRTKHRYDLSSFLLFGLRGFGEELERINTYVRNRTHRLHYRELIRRCTEKRIGERRRLLNAREANLLHILLDISEPADPFADAPAKEATVLEVLMACGALYENKTSRTKTREFRRLAKLGFIEFEADSSRDDWHVRIDFEAIRRY